MNLPPALIAELNHTMRQVVDTNHQLIRAQLSSLPQWYESKQLQERWCMGRHQLVALLEREISYQGRGGKPIRVHVDDVLRIDNVLRAIRGSTNVA